MLKENGRLLVKLKNPTLHNPDLELTTVRSLLFGETLVEIIGKVNGTIMRRWEFKQIDIEEIRWNQNTH
jgi:hypothetical protein